MISTVKFKVDTGARTRAKKKILSNVNVTIMYEGKRIYLNFPFNKTLISEIKSFEGHHWHGKIPNSDYKPQPLPEEFLQAVKTDKCWSISDTHRNRFQLEFLMGGNPYAFYDAEIPQLEYERDLYPHQEEMTNFLMARRHAIIAGEMGTGKTLCIIEAMERSGFTDWWYIAPKSVLKSIERELRIWKSKVIPELMTYNRLVTLMKAWPEGNMAPHGIVFDESARIKNPTSQRSQAAFQLANGVRSDWGRNSFIIEASGAPAPRSPADWWHQCEVACPGFLKEGTPAKFKTRLGLFQEEESFAGGVYLKQVTWLDNELKCAKCGQFEEHLNHVPGATESWHPWIKSSNEVFRLYKRMNGLVTVKFKKDCLNLPDKIYREVELKPTPSTLRAAMIISKTAKTAAASLALLRELSDGFQYAEEKDGTMCKCPLCNGNKTIVEEQPTDIENQYVEVTVTCPNCDGEGEVERVIRVAKQVPCPKEDALRDVLDEHHDIGRLVTYAGFTGSVDRCVNTSLSEGWDVIRVDGRGWKFFSADKVCPEKPDFLAMFQDGLEEFTRINFVAQAGAAGSGHTLTKSPSIFYYSNDHNADSRIQSEDRIHRIGMDVNRGATIIDCFHLPTDRLVFNNLKDKRKLQALSLGDITSCLENYSSDERLF